MLPCPHACSLSGRSRNCGRNRHERSTPRGRPAQEHPHNGHGHCVVAADGVTGMVRVRDSRDPHGPALAFTAEARRSFVIGIRAGDFPDRSRRALGRPRGVRGAARCCAVCCGSQPR
ncbi:DUF397 domain-containing protein [Kitasatospora sp. NPDC006786]|uniref:DUF397 domain-containing protein n=1 Tax=unclassified Kitasatospora TaxID=2633591 RepID=UPI0033E52504